MLNMQRVHTVWLGFLTWDLEWPYGVVLRMKLNYTAMNSMAALRANWDCTVTTIIISFRILSRAAAPAYAPGFYYSAKSKSKLGK